MILDLVSTAWTSSETARWVSIQKVHDDVLGVLGHRNRQFERAFLDIVVEFVPINKQVELK